MNQPVERLSAAEAARTFKKKSQILDVWRRLRRNKSAMIGMVILAIFIFFAVFADVIVDYEEMAIRQHDDARLLAPSLEHLFGTDGYGRDIFARVVHGARTSLTIGIISTLVSVSVGGVLGACAGYYGGAIDNIIMRFMDMLVSIPSTLLSLSIVAALGPGLRNLLIAITISEIPMFTRLIRSVILSVIGQDYIEAAKSCGTSDARIILRHILPNAIGPIIVQSTMEVSGIIIAAAGLSFLGMGIQPPSPEWGYMLNEGKEFIMSHPHLVIFPGLAIALAALSLNVIGDGLRDALDPRLKN